MEERGLGVIWGVISYQIGKYFLPRFPGDKIRNNGRWIYLSPLWVEKFEAIKNVQKSKGYYRDSGFKVFGL